jgi:hypothetical protein
MNIFLDANRMRVHCRWKEPVEVVFDRNNYTHYRQREISLRISKQCRLNRRDMQRRSEHPLLPAIQDFVGELKRKSELLESCRGARTCVECGHRGGSFIRLDPDSENPVWVCREHRLDAQQNPEENE